MPAQRAHAMLHASLSPPSIPQIPIHKPHPALACPTLQVKILTNHLPCGQEVTVDLEPSASKDEIKAKLEAATGVPQEHQKLLLSGINQIVMGDKR